MIEVNEKLREQLDSQFRKGVGCKVVVSTIDKYACDNINIDSTGTSSPLDEICDGTGKSYTFSPIMAEKFKGFASFEKNAYSTKSPKRLYRSMRADENPDTYYELYSSRYISKEYYTVPTTETNPFFFLTVPVTDGVTATGITLKFGNDDTTYPTKIVLEFYNGAELVKKFVESPTGVRYSKTFPETFDKITLKVLEMNRPNVKLTLSSLLIGTETTYENEIISVDVNRSSSLVTSELPRNEITIKMFDINGLYDPQNPNGIYYSLPGGEIRLYYTVEDTEELLGTYSIQGSPTRSGNEVTLKGVSLTFDSYANEESKVSVPTNSESLLDLGNLSKEGMSRYSVDVDFDAKIPQIYNKYDYSFLKDVSRKDLISKIANLIFGVYKEDKYGHVTLKPTLFPTDNPTNFKELRPEMICGEIELDTDLFTPNGISISTYEPGTGEAGIKFGEGEFKVENNLNIDLSFSVLGLQSFNKWVKGTKRYVIPYLSDPTIEIGDFVTFTNRYKQKIYGIVSENNYSYPSSPGSNKLTVYSIPNPQEANK